MAALSHRTAGDMTLHSYLLFVFASFVLVIVPGPDMVYMLVAFTVVKWLGAAYLIYLGVGILRSRQAPLEISSAGQATRDGRTILWQAFLSDVLNPKVAMFFLALLPQFVDLKAPHPTLQILLLGVTVNMIALPTNIALVCCSAKLTGALRRNKALSQWLQKGMGALFVALGLRLAVEKA